MLATYSGSKAFITTFSAALGEEVKKHGIIVENVNTYFVVCAPPAKSSFTVLTRNHRSRSCPRSASRLYSSQRQAHMFVLSYPKWVLHVELHIVVVPTLPPRIGRTLCWTMSSTLSMHPACSSDTPTTCTRTFVDALCESRNVMPRRSRLFQICSAALSAVHEYSGQLNCVLNGHCPMHTSLA